MSSLKRLDHSARIVFGAALFVASACSSEQPAAPATVPSTPATATPTGATPSSPATGTAGSPAQTRPAATTPAAGGAPATAAGGSAAPVVPMGGDVPVVPPPGMPGEMTPTTPPPPSSATTDWAFMGYDLGSSYNNIAETKVSKTSAANLKEAWTANMGGNVTGGALIVGDKIYASGPSKVQAFDAASGDSLWMASVGGSSTLAYSNGKLYLHASSAQVVALDANDGKVLWMKQPAPERGDGSSSPIVVGDLVIVGGSNGGLELSTGGFRGHLAALNAMTGESAWVSYTVPEGTDGASMWSSPSADPEAGVVYGGTGNNYGPPASDTSDSFIQFDVKTGDIKWKAQRVENDTFGGGSFVGPDHDFGANPVLYETMVGGQMTKLVSAGAKSGSAHAVRRDTGELVWTRSLCGGAADGSQGIFTNSAWSGKDMIFGCNEGGPATLYALDGATGDIKWMRALSGQVWGRTAIANGVGFVGTGTTLEAFDVDTGAVIKSIPSKGGTIASTIAVSNGRVAFGEGLSWSGGIAGNTLTVLTVE